MNNVFFQILPDESEGKRCVSFSLCIDELLLETARENESETSQTIFSCIGLRNISISRFVYATIYSCRRIDNYIMHD